MARVHAPDVSPPRDDRQPSGAPNDPPIWLNAEIMAQYRPQMEKFYYDPKKYKSYLEQLGIPYPTVREKITP